MNEIKTKVKKGCGEQREKKGKGKNLEGREGMELGWPVGLVGNEEGCTEGSLDGCLEGWPVGLVGVEVGCVDGFDGRELGCL